MLKVAVYCLLRANYRPGQWYDGAHAVPIPAGSFITSYGKAAAACNLSVQQVRDAFTHLERTEFATFRRTHRWTLVTVLNYATYQATHNDENTTEDTVRTSWENRQGTTNEELKNIRTLPVPSAKGDGNLFDIDNTPFDSMDLGTTRKRGGDVQEKRDADLGGMLDRVAGSIHGRHPELRRDCGAAAVRKKLQAILKHKRVPPADSVRYLEAIDSTHIGACATEQWTKDRGEFAKSLENWLSPTKERYEAPPPPAKSQPLGTVYTTWDPREAGKNG